MPSYIHNNKKYSVVALKDGSAMEIRRGSVTFDHRNKGDRRHWDSVDAWTASWPAGATACATACSSSPPAVNPIIQRYFRGKPSNIITSPSAADLVHYRDRIQMLEARLEHFNTNTKKYPNEIKTAEQEIAYYNKKLQDHTAFLRGEYVYPPTYVRKTRFYVSHDGSLHPVYHNHKDNAVFIRMFDRTAKNRTRSYTPAELGITADSAFFMRSTHDDVFVPISDLHRLFGL